MFEDALKLVLQFEGGYSNDPNDPGGATNYGITQNVYDPTLAKDVRHITLPEVTKIYQNQYWREGKCDAINTISPILATIHFDNCVNCGTFAANKMLQDVLGVKIDGILGPVSLSKITDDNELKKAYLDRRKKFYDILITMRPRLKEFKQTWYHRLHDLGLLFGLDSYEA